MARKRTEPKPDPTPEPTTRWVKIDDLIPDAANPRKHDARNLQILEASLRDYGQVEPLVVQKGTLRVIGGNGRLEAMRSLGIVDVEIREVDVDDSQARGLSVVLNRSAETATWDAEHLATALDELKAIDFDLDLFGFTEIEIDQLLADVQDDAAGGDQAGDQQSNQSGKNSAKGNESPAGDDPVPEGYKVLLDCPNEAAQTELLERLPAFIEELEHEYEFRAMVT